MADQLLNKQTSLSGEEVVTRAVQFFATAKWRPTSQSARSATFEGKVPIPWLMMLLTIIGFIFCLIPGIIMYVMVIKKLHRFHNLVVTTSPLSWGTDVTVTYPGHAKGLARRFLDALPALN